jgi:hypothetical protein
MFNRASESPNPLRVLVEPLAHLAAILEQMTYRSARVISLTGWEQAMRRFRKIKRIKVGGAEKGERVTPASQRKCDHLKKCLITLRLTDEHIIFTAYL